MENILLSMLTGVLLDSSIFSQSGYFQCSASQNNSNSQIVRKQKYHCGKTSALNADQNRRDFILKHSG